MRRNLSIPRWQYLLAASGLAAAVAGCSASGDGLVSLCNEDERGICIRPAVDADKRDASLAPPASEDAGAFDAGMSRSPLCGTVGCFPGNPSACGATPPGDGGMTHFVAADDAGDVLDLDATGIGTDVSVTMPSDAALDVSRDGSGGAPSDAASNDEPKVPQSCYVKLGAAGVVTECSPAGAGAAGDACDDSSACGAGL